MKMICSQCSVELRPFKNGVTVIETTGNPPKPYKISQADMWACPGCGYKIVTGFGNPIATQYGEEFPLALEYALASEFVIYSHQEPQELVMEQDIEGDNARLVVGA